VNIDVIFIFSVDANMFNRAFSTKRLFLLVNLAIIDKKKAPKIHKKTQRHAGFFMSVLSLIFASKCA